jgi:hypothetical protein
MNLSLIFTLLGCIAFASITTTDPQQAPTGSSSSPSSPSSSPSSAAVGGPDAEVPGWYYNLGITGMRAELVADEPKSLVIRHVFANSSASGIVRVDDRIIGAGGQPFKEAHRNGYGEEVFGATGPISEFAAAQPKFATCSGDTKPPPGSTRTARECPRGRGDQRRRRPLAV